MSRRRLVKAALFSTISIRGPEFEDGQRCRSDEGPQVRRDAQQAGGDQVVRVGPGADISRGSRLVRTECLACALGHRVAVVVITKSLIVGVAIACRLRTRPSGTSRERGAQHLPGARGLLPLGATVTIVDAAL
jgi:hypothetical protein